MKLNKEEYKKFLKSTSISDWIMSSYWRVFFICALIAYGLVLLVSSIESSVPIISIKKSEWKCTQQHQETRYGSQFVGKTASTYSYYVSVCDNYKRIKQ